jgi:DivIVA domain-containing protein
MHQRQDDPSAGFGEAPPPSSLVTPQDIQQKEFRVSRFGGYKMADVDEFLDQLTESVGRLVHENERLRREGARPVVGEPDLADVSRQADEIIERAREEAVRVVAEARDRAANISGAGMSTAGDNERAAVNAFLRREREFLQGLGELVQSHAETMKAMARQARARAAAPSDEDDAGSSSGGSRAERDAAAGAESSGTQPPAQPQPQRSRQRVTERGAKPESHPNEEPTTTTSNTAPAAAEPETDTEATQAMTPQERGAEPPVRVEQPEPATTRGQEDGGTTLRDLFWGEDA